MEKIEIIDYNGKNIDGFKEYVAKISEMNIYFTIYYKDIDNPKININANKVEELDKYLMKKGYHSKALYFNMSSLQAYESYTIDIQLENNGRIWLTDIILKYLTKINLCRLCDKYEYNVPHDWIENVEENKIYDGLRKNMNATQKIIELSKKYIETEDTENIDEICEILNIVVMPEREQIEFYWISDIEVNGMNQLCIIEGRHGYDHAYYPIDEDLYWRIKEVVERFI